MASDSFDINIKGFGETGSTSAIDTTAFQESLTKLSQSLKTVSDSANSYTKSMKEAEQKISQIIKTSLSAESSPTAREATRKQVTSKREDVYQPTAQLAERLGRLSNSIDKLATESKSRRTEESPERVGQQIKSILAAVGVGSIVKSLIESNVINPAKNTGYLINSNVISNPAEAGSNLIQSQLQGQTTSNTALAAGLGGALGFALGGPSGAILGGGLAGSAVNLLGQFQNATEIPTQQRALQQDFFENLGNQQYRLGNFGQSQYKGGFGSAEAFFDPYLPSKAAFGRSFSRFSTNGPSGSELTGIIKSLSAQGLSSPGDLSNIGSLLGQISKFTGKTSEHTAEVYKTLERTGANPIEGAQRILGLLQGGLSVSQAQSVVRNTANQTDAFAQSQQNYFGGNPLNRFRAQLAGQVFGVDTEKFFSGDQSQAEKVSGFFRRSNNYLSHKQGGTFNDVIAAGFLNQLGIVNPGTHGNGSLADPTGNIQLSRTQDKIVDLSKDAIKTGANGRQPSEILDDAIKSIANSTDRFSALNAAIDPVVNGFQKLSRLIEQTKKDLNPKTLSQKGTR